MSSSSAVHACTCDIDVSDVKVEAAVRSLRSTSKLENSDG